MTGITYNASGFDGMTYNVFETITCNGKVVAEHKDTEDEEQNIHFTKLSTEAVDANSELQLTLADKNAVITDIIYYENLKPGEEYTITGKLFDKTTGLPILDPAVNVNPYEMLDNILEHWVCDQCAERFDSKEEALAHVNASATDEHKNTTLVLSFDSDEYNALIESATMKVTENFIPEETTGHIPVNYEIDATSLAGHTIVAFATITYKGIDMAVHHDLGDEAETIYVPEIGTTAMDAESSMHVSKADGSVTITDRVEYKNLVTGMDYIMTGHLVDKATGEPVVDANGSQVTGETKFQPVDTDGYVDVTFTFDGSHLAGHTLVAYEYLAAEYKDNPVIAKHENIGHENQTIELPKIETKAFDSVTKENVVKAGEKTSITDRVYYHNLQINETYTLKGILIDKATGKAILDAEGKEVSAEKVFTAKDHDGYVDVEFVFDASAHTGKTLVAFEELFLKGYSIASHENPDDEEQTVYIPKVSTTAKDKKTGTHMAYADDMVTIIDTVSYSNVAPGTEYTIVGTIVDGETGKILAGPETETFTADAESGTKEVEFIVKADKLKGRKVVVFEELQTKFVTSRKDVETYVCNQCGRVYADKQHAVWHFEDSEECYDYTATFETIKEYGENTTIAEHKDLDDVSQTVYIPEIHTTAKDKETNTKLSYGKDVVVVDTIHYKGLQAGVEYTVSGTLMDKETGKPVTVDGKEVTADAKFTPDKTDGSVDVEFHFDATKYAGHALVAYEELYVEGKLVADHKNPDDEEQTVYVPEIGTTAVDSATKEHTGAVGESTIIDTVKYHNLVPGLEYTIKGVLMDKKTGEALTYDVSSADDSVVDAVIDAITGNNKKAYTAEAKFTPAGADGTVSLEFKFNAPEGTDIVVFE